MPGRRPLPPGQARSEKLYVRVPPAAKEAFLEVCSKRGLTEADGLRQALEQWMEKHR
jgi:hypothetical protein